MPDLQFLSFGGYRLDNLRWHDNMKCNSIDACGLLRACAILTRRIDHALVVNREMEIDAADAVDRLILEL